MISDKHFKVIIETFKNTDQCNDNYDAYSECIWELLSQSYRDTLSQIVICGPVFDSNIISKSHRDGLITMGLVGRVVVKGEQGYVGANYDGWAVWKAGQK